jgi:transposase
MDNTTKKRLPSRQYDTSFKAEAVKLAAKLGITEAARELSMPENTLYGWVRKHENGELTFAGESASPATANKLADENARLKAELREVKRKRAEEEEINEILNKAARFFAVSRKS